MDHIPDGDPSLDHAHVRGQRSNLAKSDLEEELRAHIEMGNDRSAYVCKHWEGRKAAHWEVPHGKNLKFNWSMMMLKIEEEKDERRSIVPKDQRVVYAAYACGRTATLEFVPYFGQKFMFCLFLFLFLFLSLCWLEFHCY